jgi:hypothetical protein
MMSHDMLVLGAVALGVAAIVLIVLQSHWAHHRVRARPAEHPVAMVTENARANTEGPTGPSGSSKEFRHPARHTTAKEVINRSLTIHFFGLHTGTRALARGK